MSGVTKIIVEGEVPKEVPQIISASPAISILNSLLRAGVRISYLCGGKALCGTCKIRVLEGGEYLSPMGEAEKTRLSEKGPLPEGLRLACQTYTWGTVRIKVLAPGPVKAPGRKDS